jgi:nicotinamide-nucleotide adenylyltransferase
MHHRGLYIGRFQPFHLGHLDAVKQALAECQFLIIGIGSAEQNHLPDNPFTASERWEMITTALEEARIPQEQYTIIPVRNINNYAIWVEHVSKIVPSFNAIYTGSPIIKKLFSEHPKYDLNELTFKHDISASQVRKAIKDDQDWESLVPKNVANYLKRINGPERLKIV